MISIGKAIPYKKRRFDLSLFITPPRTRISLRLEKENESPEVDMLYPGIRPPLRSSPDLHNIISQMVSQGNRPNPSPIIITHQQIQQQPLVLTYPSKFLPPDFAIQPLTITCANSPAKEPITIHLPQKCQYDNSHQVPWNSGFKVTTKQGVTIEPEIAEIGGMTRSGRCYTPEELELRRKKGKEKVNEGEPVKQKVTEEEIKEFLKLLKRSEYSVVEQLNRIPAQVSILGLLRTSEVHRLLKTLNETHVPSNISPENFDNLVASRYQHHNFI